MKNTIKSTLINIDSLWSTPFKLKADSYTNDPSLNLLSGTNVYKAEEWSLTRKKSAICGQMDGGIYDNNNNYLRYIFSLESFKVSSCIDLTNQFDFNQYKNVLEIGCGSMIQALIIKKRFMHLRYLATDFDPYIIDKCSKLSILDDIEKDILDVTNIDTETFPNDIDLLISYGVDYAIEDKYLLSLFSSAKEYSISYLMCSPSIIGILQYLNIKKNKSLYSKLLKEHKIRMHGWNRSIGYLKQLASKANMKINVIGKFGSYFCLLFEP